MAMATTSSSLALSFSSLEISSLFVSRRTLLRKNTPSIRFSEAHVVKPAIRSSIIRFPMSRSVGLVSCSSLTDEASSSVGGSPVGEESLSEEPQVRTLTWNWRGYSIRYQCAGDSGPALVLVHGFGANSDHWRKNIPFLGKSHRVYSIDLIGYGYSSKPNPREFGGKPFYTFETWGDQLNDFCLDVVKDEAFFICNSIGGLVGLQAAVSKPQICKGLMLLNISLRMLHIKKQPFIAKPFIRSFQNLLRNSPVGKLFFKSVATPESVRNILRQCYHDRTQVTDELVEAILRPGLEPGAVDVFLEFICYSGGPLPEELLPLVQCPVLIGWGDKDPWEPIELGRAYADFDTVEDFVVLPGVGHCPQDERPEMVNPLIESFVARHSSCTSNTFGEI
ncbi:PREDICTED: pheophytinase, chloroplastic [Tarenaya hassleriana]|uniref:pheophytinase, chloroplastic n=1 Tax=Tarenaya hassleriana TaxID=28532 RepID=UPI00053C3450|nr:PREDICTED: pheophytinase, chloroplastic [Tarenaya hassleriana]